MRVSTVFLLKFFILLSIKSSSQGFIWSPDSITLADPNFAMSRYHEVLRFHDPVMYLVFPVIKPLVDRKIPLQPGEGKEGFWVEGHFGYRFVIYQGKYYSIPVFQRTRFTLDASMLSRLTRDYSSPMLPFSTKLGFGLDFLLSSLDKLKNAPSGMVWTTVQLHHYSNGQADSFFLEAPVKRNNYKSGDFSTNYWRALLNIANNKKNLLITSIGFQKEVDLGGPLAISKEMKNYYGDGRLLFQLHWLKKPSLSTKNYTIRGKTNDGTVEKTIRRQFGIRGELEYIIGDLSEFTGDHKRRLGWHTYITYMPSVTNEVGIIAHTYLGRDYMNIRVDDSVFVVGLGFYVKFNGK